MNQTLFYSLRAMLEFSEPWRSRRKKGSHSLFRCVEENRLSERQKKKTRPLWRRCIGQKPDREVELQLMRC